MPTSKQNLAALRRELLRVEGRRLNPLTVDVQIRPALLRQLTERYKESRAVTSLLSPIKHRSAVERFANSKHNFRVVIHHEGGSPFVPDAKAFAERGVITLLNLPSQLAAEETLDTDDIGGDTYLATPKRLSALPKKERIAVITAWTHMHRLGDSATIAQMLRHLLLPLRVSEKKAGRASPERAVDYLWRGWRAWKPGIYVPRKPTKVLVAAAQRLGEVREGCVESLVASGMSEKGAENKMGDFLRDNTNSKMSREGYSGGSVQSVADWFAICELTNSSVLLPSTDKKPAIRAALNTYAAAMNVAFPPFYSALMSALVGGVVYT